MVTLTVIDMNPAELKYYQFMDSFYKYTGSCNDLFFKICIPKETKGINVKAFNTVRNKDEAKAMIEHNSCDF